MNWKDVPPGTYHAKIADYGLVEVESTGSIKCEIALDVTIPTGAQTLTLQGRWEQFIETKEGKPNQKLLKTLVICGMRYDDLMDLNIKGDALDRSLDLEVLIIRDEKGYARIDWINRPGGMVGIKKVSAPKKRPGAAFKAALQATRIQMGGTKKGPSDGAQEKDDLPF